MPLVGTNILHNVERDGIIHIKRSEIHHIADAMFGHIVKEEVGGLAVRVYEADAVAVADILNRHILKHRALTHAGLADDIGMARAVGRLDAEGNSLAARVGGAEVSNLRFGHSNHYTTKKVLTNGKAVKTLWQRDSRGGDRGHGGGVLELNPPLPEEFSLQPSSFLGFKPNPVQQLDFFIRHLDLSGFRPVKQN